MQQIIQALTAKYRLTSSEVISEIEKVFSSMLSQWYLVEVMEYYEKELRWGEISATDCEKNLYVEIEVIPGEKITAVCPQNRLGLHERYSDNFSIGKRRAFHLRRVDPVSLKGTSRLKVVVDRVSKTLVETLLYDYLDSSIENLSLRCTNRYVGQKSFVYTSKRLPKAAIVAATRELGEHIEVRFLGNS